MLLAAALLTNDELDSVIRRLTFFKLTSLLPILHCTYQCHSGLDADHDTARL